VDITALGATFQQEGNSGDEVSYPTPIRFQVRSLSHFTQVYNLHTNHRHNSVRPSKKGYDLAMLGVLIHVLGDAANNVGVIISGLVIWLTKYHGRYYADPAVSMAIATIILLTSIPLGV
jgi:zinc transporter 1